MKVDAGRGLGRLAISRPCRRVAQRRPIKIAELALPVRVPEAHPNMSQAHSPGAAFRET